jgi:hypothetical protein
VVRLKGSEFTLKREEIGSYPYEIERNGDSLILRFFPKSPTAKYPNDAVLVLKLEKKDKQKLIKMLT